MVEGEVFNPRTVTYIAQAGEVAQTRPLALVERACETMGFVPRFSRSDDCLYANVESGVLAYWDRSGRIVRKKFSGDRGMLGARQFDNLYFFDDQGRLAIFEQQFMDQKGYVRLFRSQEYTYLEGKPDKEYILADTDHRGKKTVMSYEDRLEESWKYDQLQARG